MLSPPHHRKRHDTSKVRNLEDQFEDGPCVVPNEESERLVENAEERCDEAYEHRERYQWGCEEIRERSDEGELPEDEDGERNCGYLRRKCGRERFTDTEGVWYMF